MKYKCWLREQDMASREYSWTNEEVVESTTRTLAAMSYVEEIDGLHGATVYVAVLPLSGFEAPVMYRLTSCRKWQVEIAAATMREVT